MHCPYCGGPIEHKLEYLPMSIKRRSIVDFILKSGPAGVPQEELIERFFRGRNLITVRTTIHYINKVIAPMRIDGKGKRFCLIKDES